MAGKREERCDAPLLTHSLTRPPRFKRCNKAYLCYVTEDFTNKIAMSNVPSNHVLGNANFFFSFKANFREVKCETYNCRAAELKLSAYHRAQFGDFQMGCPHKHKRILVPKIVLVRGCENVAGKVVREW